MTETQVLLGKISALRQRLEQAQGLANEAAGLAVANRDRLHALGEQTHAGFEAARQVDAALRQIGGSGDAAALPTTLTARARRLLERGRELLARLKALGEFVSDQAGSITDALTPYYRDTAAMADASLRMLQTFPESASAQLRSCEGLEAVLNGVARRISRLTVAVQQRRQAQDRLDHLADLLVELHSGTAMDVKPFFTLAEALVEEAAQSAPLRFYSEVPSEDEPLRPERLVACHALVVAQVMARVVRHDPELRAKPVEAVLAALVHDVGMIGAPLEIFTQKGSLDEVQKRSLESHVRLGAGLAARLLPNGAWLAEAVGGHHERLDGTGYPDGLRDLQLSSLAKLLAACDVYAAACSSRPYRPARETRTALADTLVLAEQGLLDRQHAERLLHLSFYPVGSVVELADGVVGLVVASPRGGLDRSTALQAPARPVVALLLDERGQPLPNVQHLDLATCESRSIVRTLSAVERARALGRYFPEFAA